ncbi:MAG: NAD(P)/FAD-dependent oxidoreductase [Gammaproteobacteria bacterium]|nr:NAD(P)/FAD-dependent oxidoreductase [Gammaproteobacteria bacterium]
MAIDTEALIVGAGPCGLFQVFELGLLGVRAHVVESLPKVGGQCAELYPDKPIYDIPALPVCGAQELVDRLMKQIEPFEPVFHLDQQVTQVARRGDGRFDVGTSVGEQFIAGTVIIAAGAGAFEPQRLKLDGLDDCEDVSLFYRVTDPSRFDGRRIVILGGGDSALDWTLALAERAVQLTLVHRTERFRAAPSSVEKMRALCAAGELDLRIGNVVRFEATDGQLSQITLRDSHKQEEELALDDLLVFFGLSPKLGPILEWGLALQRSTIEVDTASFQTSVPGIFAVGDINTYPGKKKLILSGFHEAALAAFAVKHHLYPDEKIPVQYTTTSPALHKRLKVDSA